MHKLEYMTEQQIEALKALGYSVESNQDGYKTFLNGGFIYGAGVQLPRKKPLHWRHARANRAMFYENGWMAARDHYARHGGK